MNPDLVRQQIANLRLTHRELMEDEEAWLLSLESETELDEVLRAIERKRQEAASLVGAIAANIAELGLRQERFERREKAMRDVAFKLMQAADIKHRQLPEATLSIRNVPPKVIIVDENSLPDIACKFVRKPDLAKIKELLTDEDCAYCAGATMSNGSETLSIRTK